jgi:hypothetical protein
MQRQWREAIGTEHAQDADVEPGVPREALIDIVPQIVMTRDLVEQLGHNARPEAMNGGDGTLSALLAQHWSRPSCASSRSWVSD